SRPSFSPPPTRRSRPCRLHVPGRRLAVDGELRDERFACPRRGAPKVHVFDASPQRHERDQVADERIIHEIRRGKRTPQVLERRRHGHITHLDVVDLFPAAATGPGITEIRKKQPWGNRRRGRERSDPRERLTRLQEPHREAFPDTRDRLVEGAGRGDLEVRGKLQRRPVLQGRPDLLPAERLLFCEQLRFEASNQHEQVVLRALEAAEQHPRREALAREARVIVPRLVNQISSQRQGSLLVLGAHVRLEPLERGRLEGAARRGAGMERRDELLDRLIVLLHWNLDRHCRRRLRMQRPETLFGGLLAVEHGRAGPGRRLHGAEGVRAFAKLGLLLQIPPRFLFLRRPRPSVVDCDRSRVTAPAPLDLVDRHHYLTGCRRAPWPWAGAPRSTSGPPDRRGPRSPLRRPPGHAGWGRRPRPGPFGPRRRRNGRDRTAGPVPTTIRRARGTPGPG